MTNQQPQSPDPSQAERIEPACTAFEAAWQAGKSPGLEDWLRNVPAADRKALLMELVLLDLYYRRQRGETLDAGKYRQRFPDLDEGWLGWAITPPQETVTHNGQAMPEVNAATGLPSGTVQYTGDYELLEEIGRGGMGVVYRGNDKDLSRTLAIKVLQEKHGDNEKLKQRFLEKAQIMRQLQHPGVTPIHEVGTLADGRPFFSMKQIQGQTQTELLRERQGTKVEKGGHSSFCSSKRGIYPSPSGQKEECPPSFTDIPRFLNIFEHVCQTVAFAHNRGILHRHLKPQNVMVGSFGEVQVLDWGLAKQMRDEECRIMNHDKPDSSIPHSSFLIPRSEDDTATGQVLGTPAYMAPEQARGEIEQLDERCDVFGLGAILCEILTGKPPFPGDTQLDSHRKAMKSDL